MTCWVNSDLRQVWVHEGMSSVVDDYQLCLRVESPSNLLQEGYFGITAATGGRSDDHDVMLFLTHRLVPLEERAQEVRVSTGSANQKCIM